MRIGLALLWTVATIASAQPPIPDDSIYQLQSSWIDRTGAVIQLKDLAGKPVVLSMFYTSCEFSCPLIVEDIKRVEARVSKSTRNWEVVLVSLDPLHDVPEVLEEFSKKRGIPAKGWRLLATKNPDNVRELSALIGTNYRRAGKYIAHSNLIVVLDAEGKIVFTKPRLNQQIEETASVVVRLAKSPR